MNRTLSLQGQTKQVFRFWCPCTRPFFLFKPIFCSQFAFFWATYKKRELISRNESLSFVKRVYTKKIKTQEREIQRLLPTPITQSDCNKFYLNNCESKPFFRSVQHSLSPHPSYHTAESSLCRLAAVSIRISRRCQHSNISALSAKEYLAAVSIQISRLCQHPNISPLSASEFLAASSVWISRRCQHPNISPLLAYEYLAAIGIRKFRRCQHPFFFYQGSQKKSYKK